MQALCLCDGIQRGSIEVCCHSFCPIGLKLICMKLPKEKNLLERLLGPFERTHTHTHTHTVFVCFISPSVSRSLSPGISTTIGSFPWDRTASTDSTVWRRCEFLCVRSCECVWAGVGAVRVELGSGWRVRRWESLNFYICRGSLMGFMFKEPALIWRNLFSFFSRVSSLAYLSTKI